MGDSVYRWSAVPWNSRDGLPKGVTRIGKNARDVPADVLEFVREHKEDYCVSLTIYDKDEGKRKWSEEKRARMALRRKMAKIRRKWPLFVSEAIHGRWLKGV